MARILRRVESIVPRRGQEYGGKACNLATLARAGFPVPAAWAMSGSTCRQFLSELLEPVERLEALLTPGRTSPDPSELVRVRSKIERSHLPSWLEKELAGTLRQLQIDGAQAIVVRSSSTHEDQRAASAAGLHRTILNVRTASELYGAVKTCWASLFDAQAVSYLRTVARVRDATMGVVLQAMVPADVSGVMFTVNPLTGDSGEMVINASYGLGCLIVDGRVSPDTYRIDKRSGDLRDRVLGDKSLRSVPDPKGGVTQSTVSEKEQAALCLTPSLISDLVKTGRRIEDHFEEPQDVEWSAVGGTLYVLQARPVSTLALTKPRRLGKEKDVNRAHIVWSNANVGEALPGVATPLTWSVLSAFSELGFRRAFGALGCTVPRDAELVGNFRGRIYLNLTEFMAIASQVPGLKPRTLIELGGGGEIERLEEDAESRSSFGFFLRLPLTASRFVRENYQLSRRVDEFERFFQEERERHRGMDLRVLSPLALDKTLHDVEQLLDDTGAIMLTCYGNLLASVIVLRAALRIVAREDAKRLERALLSGLADVESAAPGLRLWHIAAMARAEPELARIVLNTDPTVLRVEALPEGPTRRALSNFLMAYGFRGPREAEIAEARWRENPSLLFATLRAHLSRDSDGDRPVDVERRQRTVRDAASAELDRLLPAPIRAAVRHLLSMALRFMRLRERLRSHVTEVLGMLRDVSLEASRRIRAQEPEIAEDAAFYLTVDELHAVLRGHIRSIATLVRQRRSQHDRDASLPDPPPTFVGYPPDAESPPPSTDSLHGLGASSGRVEGRARVLLSPSQAAELEAGEILVAPYADVGWSPLFTVAGAVVTDLGGPLSHAAIVAREYGVPTVVNVKMGTRLIQTGDRLFIDGDTGEVRIVERCGSGIGKA